MSLYGYGLWFADSMQGHIQRMAEVVAEGVCSVDRADAVLKSVNDAQL
jgi:hypothetical protein